MDGNANNSQKAEATASQQIEPLADYIALRPALVLTMLDLAEQYACKKKWNRHEATTPE